MANRNRNAVREKVAKVNFNPGDAANPKYKQKGRGYQAYNEYRAVQTSAVDKSGEIHSIEIEQQWTQLDPLTMLSIYQKCAPVFAVVTSRVNRIAALDFRIIPNTKIEDKIAANLKDCRNMFEEYSRDNYASLGKKLKIFVEIKRVLPDVFPDLSNFDAQLMRWSQAIKHQKNDRSNEIHDFLSQPAPGVYWTDYIKELSQDALVHGRWAVYKQPLQDLLGRTRIHSLYPLPGGTVVPIKGDFVGELHGYAQITDGLQQPQLFYRDEISFGRYMPNSAILNGLTPIDALVNLTAENMLFNRLMAEYADGSNRPDKVLVFGEPANGLDFESADGKISDPLDKGEQRRIENKLNRIKREAGVAILSGVGTPIVMDLTRADTLAAQQARQDYINKCVAMVYNASQAEINETGGDGTSGRSTSESQERADNAKGVRPMLRNFEEVHTHDIIPSIFGYGYAMEFDSPRSDEEQIALAKMKVDSGLFSRNEVRVGDFNVDPIRDPSFDIPQGAQPAQQGAEALQAIAANISRR